MARYIDADLFCDWLETVLKDFGEPNISIRPVAYGSENALRSVLEVVKKQPTADVVEVKWKAIDGYEGLYEVSTFGQVRNAKGQILKPYLKHEKYTSYKKVALWKDGKYKQFSIHRLVAQAFIPSKRNGG